jgi:hypothetical protein
VVVVVAAVVVGEEASTVYPLAQWYVSKSMQNCDI